MMETKMALKTKIAAAAIAALTVIASTAAASAAPAYVTSNVNVRSGPGTGYAIVDALRRGESVDVRQCRGSWCFVEKPGPDGWVSANYLQTDGYRDRGPSWDREPVWRPAPPRPPRPPRPDWGRDDWRWGNNFGDRGYGGRGNGGGGYGGGYGGSGGSTGGSVCITGPDSYFCAGN
jgi:uncharacterized protein YraI